MTTDALAYSKKTSNVILGIGSPTVLKQRSELVIENGVVIDDSEAVLEGISKLSGKNISNAETFKKFITNEKATKFYIDNKCACKMQHRQQSLTNKII